MSWRKRQKARRWFRGAASRRAKLAHELVLRGDLVLTPEMESHMLSIADELREARVEARRSLVPDKGESLVLFWSLTGASAGC